MIDQARCDVLIVEDEMIQCEEMAGFLARAGLDVQAAHNGLAGLRQAAAFRPRVALLDYNLPDTTGVQLAERLRAMLPDMAILMMSGRIDGLSEQTLQTIGIKVFVNKPLPLRALRQAVLAIVRPTSANSEPQRRGGGWRDAAVNGAQP